MTRSSDSAHSCPRSASTEAQKIICIGKRGAGSWVAKSRWNIIHGRGLHHWSSEDWRNFWAANIPSTTLRLQHICASTPVLSYENSVSKGRGSGKNLRRTSEGSDVIGVRSAWVTLAICSYQDISGICV